MLNTRSLKGKQIMQFWSAFLAFPAKGGIIFLMFLGPRLTFFMFLEGTRSVILFGVVLEAKRRGNQRVSRVGDVPRT